MARSKMIPVGLGLAPAGVSDTFAADIFPVNVWVGYSSEWARRKAEWAAKWTGAVMLKDIDGGVYSASLRLREMFSMWNPISQFDPVVAELAYRWFCPPGGQVVDPFCGGPVRGLVAAYCGLQYWGCDLRPEQVDENYAAWCGVRMPPEAHKPLWVVGESKALAPQAPRADFIFSCPPYWNLERYSDAKADLSTMSWEEFVAAHGAIIGAYARVLRPDRFAVWVVGDVRDKQTGAVHRLADITVSAFEANGFILYNNVVFCTPLGSNGFRAARVFPAARKLLPVHQNVLVFYRGNTKAITRLEKQVRGWGGVE